MTRGPLESTQGGREPFIHFNCKEVRVRRPSHALQQVRQRILAGSLIVTLGIGAVAWTPPAFANGSDAEAIAAIAAAASQAEGQDFPLFVMPQPIDPVTTEDGEVSFEHETVTVTISSPTFQGTNVTVGSQTISISGPNSGVSPVSVNFGTFVADGSGPIDSVIQKNNRQLREMVVINSPTAPSTYSFTLTGASFVMLEGGSVAINDPDGNPIGGLAPAWARDANGNSVPTHYTVGSNGELIQHVDHSNAAFPVVIDPSISFGWYIYIRYNKSEVQSLGAKLTMYGYQHVIPALCAPLAIVNLLASGTCYVMFSIYGGSIADTIRYARANNRCLEFRLNWSTKWIVGWRSYSC